MARDMKKKYASDAITQAKLYDMFSVKVRKDSGLMDMMKDAAEKAGTSKNHYVVQAVIERLKEDGYDVSGCSDE